MQTHTHPINTWEAWEYAQTNSTPVQTNRHIYLFRFFLFLLPCTRLPFANVPFDLSIRKWEFKIERVLTFGKEIFRNCLFCFSRRFLFCFDFYLMSTSLRISSFLLLHFEFDCFNIIRLCHADTNRLPFIISSFFPQYARCACVFVSMSTPKWMKKKRKCHHNKSHWVSYVTFVEMVSHTFLPLPCSFWHDRVVWHITQVLNLIQNPLSPVYFPTNMCYVCVCALSLTCRCAQSRERGAQISFIGKMKKREREGQHRILVTDSIANSKSMDDWLWLLLQFTHHFLYFISVHTNTLAIRLPHTYQIDLREMRRHFVALCVCVCLYNMGPVSIVFICALNVWLNREDIHKSTDH